MSHDEDLREARKRLGLPPDRCSVTGAQIHHAQLDKTTMPASAVNTLRANASTNWPTMQIGVENFDTHLDSKTPEGTVGFSITGHVNHR